MIKKTPSRIKSTSFLYGNETRTKRKTSQQEEKVVLFLREFKKKIRTPFGRDAKESESGRAQRSVWSVALYRSR